MKLKSLVIICFCLFINASLNGQFADSLREVFKYTKSIDARLESRNSFINNELISVNGARLGVAFQRKLRIGGGVSWLNTVVPKSRISLNADTSYIQYFKFVYFCAYADFVFYRTKRWQLSVPIQAGIGASWFQNKQNYYWGNNDKKYALLIYEPGITAQFKVFKWFGLGADIAYRFSLKNNKKVGEGLSSPTYSFKILFWFDQLFYQTFPNSKITKRWGPAYW